MYRLLLVALMVAPTLARADTPKQLAGRYIMDFPGGSDVLELRADGSASLGANETTWSTHDGKLVIGKDEMAYQLKGKKLVLTMSGAQVPFKRIGDAGKAKPEGAKAKTAQLPPGVTEQDAMNQLQAWLKAQEQANGQSSKGSKHATAKAEPAVAAGGAEDQRARVLLTATPWCSSTNGQFTAGQNAQRLVFRSDGTVSAKGGEDADATAWSGTPGKGNDEGLAHWKVETLHILIDRGDGAGFKDVGTASGQDPSGFPMLHAQGHDYSMCR